MAKRRSHRKATSTLPPLPSTAEPETVRLMHRNAGGPTGVMKANWRDPDDLNVHRRMAREISGWRSYCPLRRLMEQGRSSAISAEHILAADMLRKDST
jgi:hypothetical protein